MQIGSSMREQKESVSMIYLLGKICGPGRRRRHYQYPGMGNGLRLSIRRNRMQLFMMHRQEPCANRLILPGAASR